MAKVVIAHPFDIWSTGMACVLAHSGCRVIAQLTDGAEALAHASEARADLIVIDGGLLAHVPAGASERDASHPYSGRIVVVLEPGGNIAPQTLLKWDVNGLIFSHASAQDFMECIARVRLGHRWLDPALVEDTAPQCSPETTRTQPAICEALSSREAEVARLAASGLSNKKIAQILAVSDGTIKMHMHNILTKLHLVSRVELSQHYRDVGRLS